MRNRYSVYFLGSHKKRWRYLHYGCHEKTVHKNNGPSWRERVLSQKTYHKHFEAIKMIHFVAGI